MIRIYILLALVILTLTSCQEISEGITNKFNGYANVSPLDTILYSKATEIYFPDTLIDLGTVKEGKEYQLIYGYENRGKVPLMIFNVSPSCGCTIAEYSHHHLAVGGRDSIIAKFDSKNKLGSHLKNIKINCNSTQKLHTLSFRVNVVP